MPFQFKIALFKIARTVLMACGRLVVALAASIEPANIRIAITTCLMKEEQSFTFHHPG
jgi:hypothetical protein